MFSPWVARIPWRRKWPPTPLFLPGEFHGQKSLSGYSQKELDATERLSDYHSVTLKPWQVLKESHFQKLVSPIKNV